MRLYLIRHGRTQPAGPDSHSWPLSSEGEAQARALADAPFWRGISALFSSPEEKAVSTVRPSAERYGLDIRREDRLREVRRPPVWVEDYESAVRRFFEHPESPPEGWESRESATARVTGCLREIAVRHPAESVAVCGHGLALTLYLSALEDLEGDIFGLWRSIGFAQVAVVEDGRVVVPFVDPGAVGD